MKTKHRKVADTRLLRGFIGITRYWSEEKQTEMLRKAGVPLDVCYIHSWRRRPIDTKERDEAIRSLGPRRVLVVCEVFLLARNMVDLLDVLKRIAASGGAIRTASNGREYAAVEALYAHEDIAKAVEAYKDHHYSPGREAARAAGKLGGSQKKADYVMPDDQARPHWFNLKLLIPQALELMTGWTRSTAYDTFGSRRPDLNRGRPKGSKNKRRSRRARKTAT